MNKRLILGFVLFVISIGPPRAWGWGHGGGGGFHGSFGGGGVHGGVHHPGIHRFGCVNCAPRQPFFDSGHFGGFHDGFFFRDQRFFFGNPGSLPPLGATGPTPFFSPGSSAAFRAPFFCVPDGLEFGERVHFFAHLHQAHGIPLEKAWFACHFLSSGQLGFWGR